MSRRRTARNDRHGMAHAYNMAEKHRRAIKPLLTADEIATSLNESKAIREEAAKIVATFGRGSIARAEEDLRFVIREYGHEPLTADEITEIGIDECKEMTKEDSEKITDCVLRGRMELQSFISTENSDWFWEYSKEQGHDRQ